MPDLAIVILNYNGRRHLEKFLPSVVAHSSSHSIFIADNGSTDDSISWLKEEHPEIPLILLEKNYGFSQGYNLALAQVEARYYVLLNSDVEVSPRWIDPIWQFMEAHPQVAACQPKILSYQHPTYFEYAGAGGGYLDFMAYPFCRGRIFDLLEEDQGQYNDQREVFWASGAALCIRADLYHQSGGLDADFFAHMEEIDLCWRLKNLGYRVHYIGTSVVYHLGGGTLSQQSDFKTYLNFRNHLALLYKNLPLGRLLCSIPVKTALDVVAFFLFLFKHERKHAQAVWKANVDFYSRLGHWWSKRALSFSKSAHKDLKPLSIIWAYFVRKKKHFSEL